MTQNILGSAMWQKKTNRGILLSHEAVGSLKTEVPTYLANAARVAAGTAHSMVGHNSGASNNFASTPQHPANAKRSRYCTRSGNLRSRVVHGIAYKRGFAYNICNSATYCMELRPKSAVQKRSWR